ncbi:hypothetical protein HQ520_03910 [bacterium]|nr:hypothetical protein [bacterium]
MNSKPENTVRCRTFEEAALLDSLGLGEYAGTEPEGRRVAILFRDPSGEAVDALRRHNGPGIQVNSRRFSDGLDWAKRIVFSTKRG